MADDFVLPGFNPAGDGDPSQGTTIVLPGGRVLHLAPGQQPYIGVPNGGDVFASGDPDEIARYNHNRRTRDLQGLVKVGALVGGAAALGGAGGAAGGAARTYPLVPGGPITATPIGAGGASGAGLYTGGGTAAAGAGAATGAGGAMAGFSWADLIPSIIGGVADIAGAHAQAGAAGDAAALSQRQFDIARGDALPRINAGNAAVDRLAELQGLYTGTPNRSLYNASPGRQFALDEGQNAINRSLAAKGKALSGQGVKEGIRYATGVVDQDYGSYVDQLLATAGLGTTGASQSLAAGNTNAYAGGNAIQNRGAARSSGYRAVGDAVGGGYSDYLLDQYLRGGR